MMAAEVCRRGRFFFEIWAAQDDEAFLYSDEQLASYVEAFEFVDWLAQFDINDPCFIRGIWVRSLLPENPEWDDGEG